MFLGVILGWVTTLGVKIGLFLGLSDTLEFLECFRQTDTTERFYCMWHTDKIYKMSLCSVQYKTGLVADNRQGVTVSQVAKMWEIQVIL